MRATVYLPHTGLWSTHCKSTCFCFRPVPFQKDILQTRFGATHPQILSQKEDMLKREDYVDAILLNLQCLFIDLPYFSFENEAQMTRGVFILLFNFLKRICLPKDGVDEVDKSQ